MRLSSDKQSTESNADSVLTGDELEPGFPLDRYDVIRTPQEWHQEHLDFVKTNASLYDDPVEADILEAYVYFDHVDMYQVVCCTYCLEMIPRIGVHKKTIECPSCKQSQSGEQSVRAAYLALLGMRHPNCTLNEEDFSHKTHGLETPEFVNTFKDKCHEHRQKLILCEYRALNLIKRLFGSRVCNQITTKGETWVKGADNKHYRLFWSRHGNVAVYEHRYKTDAKRAGKSWKPIAAYCGHFGEEYPIGDQIIAQICMIKTNPSRYVKQANKVKHKDLHTCGPEYTFENTMDKIKELSGVQP